MKDKGRAHRPVPWQCRAFVNQRQLVLLPGLNPRLPQAPLRHPAPAASRQPRIPRSHSSENWSR
eukprot:1476275-Rhodomonas_salina.2